MRYTLRSSVPLLCLSTQMTFPWLVIPAAGLSSGAVQRSASRGTPVDDSRDYRPSGVLPHRPTRYPDYDSPLSLRTADINGAKPRWQPIATTSDTKTPMSTKRSTSPLKPQYQLPGCTLRPGTMSEAMGGGSRTSRSFRDRPSTSLDTSDIQGARTARYFATTQRGEWAKFTDRSDVSDVNVSGQVWQCGLQSWHHLV